MLVNESHEFMLPRQAKKWLRFMYGCKGQVGFVRGGVQCLAGRGLFVVGTVQNSKDVLKEIGGCLQT